MVDGLSSDPVMMGISVVHPSRLACVLSLPNSQSAGKDSANYRVTMDAIHGTAVRNVWPFTFIPLFSSPPLSLGWSKSYSRIVTRTSLWWTKVVLKWTQPQSGTDIRRALHSQANLRSSGNPISTTEYSEYDNSSNPQTLGGQWTI